MECKSINEGSCFVSYSYMNPEMATDGFRDFFPALTSLPSPDSLTSQVLNFIFPGYSYVPTLHLKVFGSNIIDVKRPLVAVMALAGFFIFQYAGRRLIRLGGKKSQFKGAFSFGMAMLWYSVMCIGGFWYDSISHHQFFYSVDVVGTACCSASVIAGSLGFEDRVPANRRILASVYVLVTVVVFSCSPVMRELMYIVPSLLALTAALIFCNKVDGGRTREKERKKKEEVEKEAEEEVERWMLFASVGTVVALGGLVFNRWITMILGPHFCETFCFFLGSHAAVWGVFRMVVATNHAGFLVS